MVGYEDGGDEAIDGENTSENARKQVLRKKTVSGDCVDLMSSYSLSIARSGRITPADRAPMLDLAIP